MSKTVELLLTENVENLGIVGDVVTVRMGYARNYLLPFGMAVQPTDAAKKALADRRAEAEREMAALRADLEKVTELLEGHEITLERSCNDQGHLYGSVSQQDIATALQEAGFPQVKDSHIRIGSAIKRVDSYAIPVQVAPDLKAEIKLWVVADRSLDFEREEMEFDDDGELIEKPKEKKREEKPDKKSEPVA